MEDGLKFMIPKLLALTGLRPFASKTLAAVNAANYCNSGTRGAHPSRIKRKLFSCALAGALVCSAALAHAEQSPADQLGFQVGIAERSFQNFTLFEAMDKTAALGLKYFSLSAKVKLDDGTAPLTVDLTDHQIAAIKKHAAEKGLTIVNAYVSLPANEERCRREFELAKRMGIDVLVGEPPTNALDLVEKLCKEYNVKVAIHDHPKGHSAYWQPENVLAAIKGRTPLMGACADTGHWVRSGLDPVECLKKLHGHVICLHFKDLNVNNPKGHDVPWGTGVGNCKGMMEELQRQGFHGAFLAEYEYHYDSSTPELAQCAKFFNDTCAQLVAAKPAAP